MTQESINWWDVRDWIYEFTECGKFYLLWVAIITNNLLIFVIGRNKRLLHSRTNTYFVFIAITHLLYVVIGEWFLWLLMATHILDDYNYPRLCVSDQPDKAVLLVYVLFCFCPGLEWYLTHFKQHLHKKLEQHHVKFVLSIILLGILHFMISAMVCYYGSFQIRQAIQFGTFLTPAALSSILFFMTCKIPKTKESDKTEYVLRCSKILLFSWVPLSFCHMLYIIDPWYAVMTPVFITEFLAICLAYGAQIAVLVILYRGNKNKKSTGANKNNKDEDLDDKLNEEVHSNNIYQNGQTNVKV